jgi:hypothetical protein
MKTICFAALRVVAIVWLPFALVAPAAAQEFEANPTLRASDVLPAKLVRGEFHTVDDAVQNDGVMNRYKLRIPQGELSVVGTDRLEIWIEETAGLQKMEEVKQSEVFGEALKNSVKAPVKFAGNLVENPAGTVEDVGKGAGDFFNSIGHSLFGGASEKESGTVETVVGYDAIKRQFAFQFGVDPYTTNELVQERLVELSRAAFAGGVPLKAATLALPTAGAVAIRGTGGAYGLSQLIRDKSPAELKEINGAKLAQMGVPQDAATRFLEHPDFSPTKKTIITHMLERMEGVDGRAVFIERAGQATDEPMAFFFQEHAEDLAGYHAKVAPLARLVSMQGLVFGQRADGTVVGVFPVDYLTWRQKSATTVSGLEPELKKLGAKSPELWVAGSMSPLYAKNMTALGWTVQENARDKLRP